MTFFGHWINDFFYLFEEIKCLYKVKEVLVIVPNLNLAL